MCIVFITAKAREGYRPVRHDGTPPRMVGTSKSILILARFCHRQAIAFPGFLRISLRSLRPRVMM
jgi:hypothetical protein